MSRNKIGEDSPIPKFYIPQDSTSRRRRILTILEEGEFKLAIDGCISAIGERFYVYKRVFLKCHLQHPSCTKSTTYNKIQVRLVVCVIITVYVLYIPLSLHHCYTWKLQSGIASSMHFCAVVRVVSWAIFVTTFTNDFQAL